MSAAIKQQMLDAGAPASQVEEWAAGQKQKMLEAGAPPAEVAKYFGEPPEPDLKHVNAVLGANIDGMSWQDRASAAENPMEAFETGLQMSSGGLAARGRMPDKILPQDAGLAYKTLSAAGMMAGDLPAMVAGFIAGAPVGTAGGAAAGTAIAPGPGTVAGGAVGGLVVGGAAANALPEAIRQVLMDQYQHPDGAKSWDEVWSRASGIAWETTKAGIVGGVTAPVGGVVGSKVAGATGSRALGTGTGLTAMAVSATAVGGALHGEVPTADDFIVGAVLALGMHGAGTTVGAMKRFVPSEQGKAVAQNLRDIYSRTGMGPQEVIQRVIADPALKSEMLAPRAADGTLVTPGLDAIRKPDPKPIRQEKPTVAPKAAESVPQSTVSLIEQLETGGMRDPDHAISTTGAVGRHQIMPDTARQYGFDPAQLTDRNYNEHVSRTILADLNNKFDGDMQAVLIGYNAGPGRARAWLRAGRDNSILPLETQKYLRRAEQLGGLDRGLNEKQLERHMVQQGDVPPREWVPPDGVYKDRPSSASVPRPSR